MEVFFSHLEEHVLKDFHHIPFEIIYFWQFG